MYLEKTKLRIQILSCVDDDVLSYKIYELALKKVRCLGVSKCEALTSDFEVESQFILN